MSQTKKQGQMLAEFTREGNVTRAHLIPSPGSIADNAMVEGFGEARLNATDHDIPHVGRAIAVARAMQDIGRELENVYLQRTVSKRDYDLEAIRNGKQPRYIDEVANSDLESAIPGREDDSIIMIELTPDVVLPVAVRTEDIDYLLALIQRASPEGGVIFDSRQHPSSEDMLTGLLTQLLAD